MSRASSSARRVISSKALRRISPRSRGGCSRQLSCAATAASRAAMASSSPASATSHSGSPVDGSSTDTVPPPDPPRPPPPMKRSLSTDSTTCCSWLGEIVLMPRSYPSPQGVTRAPGRARRPHRRLGSRAMISLSTRHLATAGTCLLLLLAGCGGGSDKGGSTSGGGSSTSTADYKKQVQDIGNSFRSQVSDAQSTLSGASTNADRAKGLDQIRTAFKDVAGKIDNLNPPSGAQDEQDKLVQVLNTGADDIGTVEDAIKKNDISGLTSSVSKIQTDSTNAQSALQGLKSAVEGK